MEQQYPDPLTVGDDPMNLSLQIGPAGNPEDLRIRGNAGGESERSEAEDLLKRSRNGRSGSNAGCS